MIVTIHIAHGLEHTFCAAHCPMHTFVFSVTHCADNDTQSISPGEAAEDACECVSLAYDNANDICGEFTSDRRVRNRFTQTLEDVRIARRTHELPKIDVLRLTVDAVLYLHHRVLDVQLYLALSDR